MKKYLKKFTSIFLSLVMLCSGLDTNTSAEEITQETKDAYFTVEYADEVRNPNTFLELLENGNKVDSTFEKVSENNNSIEYKISGLEVYTEDLLSTNTYSLQTKEITGYSYNKSLFTFNENYSLDENIQLSLAAYNVTGRVSFDGEGVTKDEYFSTVFKDFDVTSQEDDGDYTFTINNLYTADVNGNTTSYSIDPTLEGWNCNVDTITINGDTKLDIQYSKGTSSNDSSNVNAIDDEVIHNVVYEGTKSFDLNWYDDVTEGRTSYGTIQLKVNNKTLNYTTSDGVNWTTNDTSDVFDVNQIKFTATSASSQYQSVNITGIPSKIDDKDTTISLSYDNSDSSYEVVQESDNTTYSIYKLTDFEMSVIVSDGGVDISNLKSYLSLTSSNSDLKKKLEAGDYKLSLQGISGGKATYTLTVSGLKEYTSDGSGKTPVTYDASIKDVKSDGYIDYKDGDQFEVTYDNTSVPNYGSDTSSVKNGGSLKLLLSGTTGYSGTKVWLNGDATKPSATWALWRYSKKDGVDYKQASPVTEDLNGKEVSSWDATNGGTWNVGDLPKYDTDGYEYVYLARETMNSSAFVKHYGTQENNFEDDINADGKKQSESVRDGDSSVYNGGTLSNRIENKITTSVTKVWVADYYASKLSDTSVTAKLQVKKKSDSAWSDYKGSDDKEVTVTLGGYKVETGMPTYEMSVDQYDEEGNELEYQWVEVSVADSGTKNALNEKGDKATLTINKKAKDGEEYFEETSTTENNQTTLTSTLIGTTTYYIHKKWNHGDNDKENYPTSIEVYFEQSGKTGSKTDSDYNQTITMTGTGTEWTYTVTELPKFNSTGAKYTYSATEKSVSKYNTSYSYNKKDSSSDIDNVKYGYNNVYITNSYQNEGDYQEIQVRKVWYDDGDAYQRQEVKGVVKAEDGTELNTFTLNTSNNWESRVAVTAYQYEADGQMVITTSKNTPDEYKVTDNLYKGTYTVEESSVGGNEVKDNEVTTSEAKYKVSYATKSGQKGYKSGYYTIVNRRVGTVDLSVTKTWTDGNTDKETRKAYGATVQLTSDEVEINENSITVAGETYQVSSTQALTGEDGQTIYFYNLPKYDENGKFIHYEIKENDPDEKLEDADYSIGIFYGDYEVGTVSSEQPYVISHDAQAIYIVNTRTKTKSVTFYKLWKDTYAYKNKKRPDIYITLYSNAQKDANGNLVVSDQITEYQPYIDRVWSATDQEKIYEWSCTFENLPKYDVNGKEITYYASEKTHVDASSLDYQDLQYKEGKPDGSGTISPDGITATLSDGTSVLKEGNTFVNALKSSVKVQGKKVWKNIPEGFPTNALPTLTFTLDQYLGGTRTSKGIATIEVSASSSTTFNFLFQYQGKNNADGTYAGDGDAVELPKYNDAGALYTYKVRESVSDESAQAVIKETDPISPDNYYEIDNTYIDDTSNTASIKVTKSWNGVTSNYPILTFTLHRVSVSKDNNQLSDTVVTTKTLDVNSSTENSVTFENQLVIAPNGVKFKYYVVESSVNGYSQTNSNGTVESAFELDKDTEKRSND